MTLVVQFYGKFSFYGKSCLKVSHHIQQEKKVMMWQSKQKAVENQRLKTYLHK